MYKRQILKHPNVRLTEDGGAEPYLHGKVEWDVADIFIEEYKEVGRDDRKEKDTDGSAPEETGYELLSEADIDVYKRQYMDRFRDPEKFFMTAGGIRAVPLRQERVDHER